MPYLSKTPGAKPAKGEHAKPAAHHPEASRRRKQRHQRAAHPRKGNRPGRFNNS